jgi:hypothetical protein
MNYKNLQASLFASANTIAKEKRFVFFIEKNTQESTLNLDETREAIQENMHMDGDISALLEQTENLHACEIKNKFKAILAEALLFPEISEPIIRSDDNKNWYVTVEDLNLRNCIVIDSTGKCKLLHSITSTETSTLLPKKTLAQDASPDYPDLKANIEKAIKKHWKNLPEIDVKKIPTLGY